MPCRGMGAAAKADSTPQASELPLGSSWTLCLLYCPAVLLSEQGTAGRTTAFREQRRQVDLRMEKACQANVVSLFSE